MTQAKFETIKWPSKSFTCRIRNSCDTWLQTVGNTSRSVFILFAGQWTGYGHFNNFSNWTIGHLVLRWRLSSSLKWNDIFAWIHTAIFICWTTVDQIFAVLTSRPDICVRSRSIFYIVSFCSAILLPFLSPKTAHKLESNETEIQTRKTMHIKAKTERNIKRENRKWQTIHKFSFPFNHIDHVSINKTLLGCYFLQADIYGRFLALNET